MSSSSETLPFVVERTVVIAAGRETVFRFFTDSQRFAAWWGEGSTIDPRAGGAVVIRYPNGVRAGGSVVEVVPPRRVVFSFGYESGQPMPTGGSLVTITLEPEPAGTRLHLRHELPSAAARDAHVQGWRYQLALFANVAARHEPPALDALADRFFGLWAMEDAARRAELAALAVDTLAFRDSYSSTEGLDDLDAHVAGARRFMPGVVLERVGPARQCQGTVLVDWVAKGADGVPRGKGTNVFELAPDGRIARVTGVWG
jgi:uncharacterized protein YndB with AHSA1/START domain